MLQPVRQPVSREASGEAPWLDSGAAIVIIAGAVFLYLELFTWRGIPIFTIGDQAINLDDAARMLRGEHLYRDIFQYTPPGTELVYLALFKLFGLRAWVPEATLLVLGLGYLWVSAVLSRPILTSWNAYLPGLMFLTLGLRNILDATHHKFSVLLVLVAAAAIVRERTWSRISLAGFLGGVASFFTQTRLLSVLALALFLLIDTTLIRRRSGRDGIQGAMRLISVCFATVVLLYAYYAYEIGIRRFAALIVDFPLFYYRLDTLWNTWRGFMIGLPPARPWYFLPTFCIWLFVHALIPAVFVLALIRLGAEPAGGPTYKGAVLLINLVGLSLAATIAYAPIWVRLCEISLPAFIVYVWLIESCEPTRILLVPLTWLAVLAMLIALPARSQLSWKGYLQSSAGKMAMSDPMAYDEYRWLLQNTQPGEYVLSGYPDPYFPLGLKNGCEVPYITNNGYTRPEQAAAVLKELEGGRFRLVIWNVDLECGARGCPTDSNIGAVRTYMKTHYTLVKDFANGIEMWVKNPAS